MFRVTLLNKRAPFGLLVVPFFCLIIANIPLRAQDSAAKPPNLLTLEEAVNIAQANNRQVKNAELAVAIDEDQIAGAHSYRFPSLNVYALGTNSSLPSTLPLERAYLEPFRGSARCRQATPKFTPHCGRRSMA